MDNVIDPLETLLVRETLAGRSQLFRIDQNNVIEVQPGARYQVLDSLDLNSIKIIRSQKVGFDLLIYLPGGRVIVFKKYFLEFYEPSESTASIDNLPPLSSDDPTKLKVQQEDGSLFASNEAAFGAIAAGGLGLLGFAVSRSNNSDGNNNNNNNNNDDDGNNNDDDGNNNNNDDDDDGNNNNNVDGNNDLTNFQLVLREFESTLNEISRSSIALSDKELLVDQLSDALDLAGTNPSDTIRDLFLIDNAEVLAELAKKAETTDTNNSSNTTNNDLTNFQLVLREFESTLNEISRSGIALSDKELLVDQLSDALDLVGTNPSDTIRDLFLIDNAEVLAELAKKAVLTDGSTGTNSSGVVINNFLGSGSTSTGDTTTPAITSFSTTEDDGTFKVGETISIQMNGSENFVLTGDTSTLRLLLNNGESATFESGSGTSTLNFRYLVSSGDFVGSLDVNSVVIGSTTIKNSSGTDFDLTGFTNLSQNHSIFVQPTITEVTTSDTDGTFINGETISFSVVFSDPINVTGDTSNFRLALNSGGSAVFTSGSGTDTLNFEYTLSEGDITDSLQPLALAENGAILLSDNGQSPSTEISAAVALDFTTNHVIEIDADSPEIASISNAETSRGDKQIVEGDAFFPVEGVLTVTFDQPVSVSLGDGDQISMVLEGLFTGTDDNGDGDEFNDAALATLIDDGIDAATPRTTLSFQYTGFLRDQGDFGSPDPIEAIALIRNTTDIIDESGNSALLAISAENNIEGSLELGAGRFLSQTHNLQIIQNGNEIFADENIDISSIILSDFVSSEDTSNILVHIYDANGNSGDYIDEYTGKFSSLDTALGKEIPMRALFSVEEILNGTANFISPLTELAVRVAEREGLDLWDYQTANVNSQVAHVLGLDSLSFENPVFTTDTDLINHSDSEITHAAVLATFSMFDSFTGSIDKTLEILVPLFTDDGFRTEEEMELAFHLIKQSIDASNEDDVFLPEIHNLVQETSVKLMSLLETSKFFDGISDEYIIDIPHEEVILEIDGVPLDESLRDLINLNHENNQQTMINDKSVEETNQTPLQTLADPADIIDHSNEEFFG